MAVCGGVAAAVVLAAWRLHVRRKEEEESSDLHYLATDEVQMADSLAVIYGDRTSAQDLPQDQPQCQGQNRRPTAV